MYDVVLLSLKEGDGWPRRAAYPRFGLRGCPHRGRRPGVDGDRGLGRGDRRRPSRGSTARPAPRVDLARCGRQDPAGRRHGRRQSVARGGAQDGPAVRARAQQAPRRPGRRPDRAGSAAGGDPAAGRRPSETDLAAQLGLPRTPAAVAAAVLGSTVRRLDLLRNDGGSVTVDGALVGGTDGDGGAVPWRGRIEVDDAVLSDGTDRSWPARSATPAATRPSTACSCSRGKSDRRPGRGGGRGPGDGPEEIQDHAGTHRGAPRPRTGRLRPAPRR